MLEQYIGLSIVAGILECRETTVYKLEAKGDLVSLSEQQLVDCSAGRPYGNHGCNGGLMDGAFEYAIENGMCTESSYAYTAKGGTCHSCDPVVSISSCVDVTPNNQQHLKEAVATGPVSVAIEADTRTFQMYTGGVITSSACGTKLDHGVLVVGYGELDNTPFWLVKNSWSTSWGDDGYVRIEEVDYIRYDKNGQLVKSTPHATTDIII